MEIRRRCIDKSVYDDDSEKQLVDVIGFSSALNPEELYIKQEFSIALENALNNSLTEYERNVLDRFLDGKSYSDIAAELDHSVKSVDNALQRIRKKLEKLFPSSL